MTENTVLGKLTTFGDPQKLSREIVRALAETGKVGYHAIFEEISGKSDELRITFTRNSDKQVLIIPAEVWRHQGGIRSVILDELTI